MRNIMVVFGTRPEAIKMAPLIKKLEENKDIANIVCVTAQHREMLDQVLEVFDIKPDYDLNIMKQGQTLSDITTRALLGLNEVLLKEKPNIVLVHGDTTTSFVGALAAFYNQIDVGHVEAGLRTWNKYSPFPEEMNRQMVDCIADMYFAPTEKSKQNLLKEGKEETKIYVTGNTAIDAMKFTVKEDYTNEVFDWIGNDRMILLTAHRRENLGEPLYNIFRGIKKAIDEFCTENNLEREDVIKYIKDYIEKRLKDENNKFKCKYRLVREMIDTIPDEQKTAGNSTESIDLEQKV